MGQKPSKSTNNIFGNHKLSSLFTKHYQNRTQKPEEPIKFQFKSVNSKSKHREPFGLNIKNVISGVKNECNGFRSCNDSDAKVFMMVNASKAEARQSDKTTERPYLDHNNSRKRHDAKQSKRRSRKKVLRKEVGNKHFPMRTNSEPNLRSEKKERSSTRRSNGGDHRRSRRRQFGYEIQDLEDFLTKASLEKPANIPVVLAFSSVLYQTRTGGYQDGISLPLGMVVNAIFKNENWLYVQTPHTEEGYVSYAACLPLGIIPSHHDDKISPCWEKSTDIFPRPPGNMTDTEKMSKSDNEEEIYLSKTKYRTALSTCGEKSVDHLYLRAAAIAKGKGTRHTLLVINTNYNSLGKESISVAKNEVVFLLNAYEKGWFYVKNKEGKKGFIPSVIAGHGFL